MISFILFFSSQLSLLSHPNISIRCYYTCNNHQYHWYNSSNQVNAQYSIHSIYYHNEIDSPRKCRIKKHIHPLIHSLLKNRDKSTSSNLLYLITISLNKLIEIFLSKSRYSWHRDTRPAPMIHEKTRSHQYNTYHTIYCDECVKIIPISWLYCLQYELGNLNRKNHIQSHTYCFCNCLNKSNRIILHGRIQSPN